MRMRTWAAALGAGSLVLAGSTGDDSKPPRESDTAPVTAGPDSEHVLIHGTVSRGDEPIVGAQLSLTLMPDDASEVEVGETIETFDTPMVETDDEGGYAIELDPDELSSKFFNGNYLNFDVGIVDNDELGIWASHGVAAAEGLLAQR